MAENTGTEKRGVYEMECLSVEGFPLIIALSYDNRRVIERAVYPFENRSQVIREVRAELDTLDPGEPWKGGGNG